MKAPIISHIGTGAMALILAVIIWVFAYAQNQETVDFVCTVQCTAPDGVRVEFYTTQDYRPGSVSVWRNGMRLDPFLEDGFLENGGNAIELREAPWEGDTLQAQYDPA